MAGRKRITKSKAKRAARKGPSRPRPPRRAKVAPKRAVPSRSAPSRATGLSAGTVQQIAAEQFGYRIGTRAAAAVAGGANALIGAAHQLGALGLTEVEPPFGYPVLIGEATRIRRNRS